MSDKAIHLKEERMRKFRDMGIPSPMEPVDPSQFKNLNADPAKLSKLDAIRNGLKKNEFQAFIQKTTPTKQFESVPVPKQKKNPNAPPPTNVPEIKAFSPDSSSSSEAALLERTLYGEVGAKPNPYQESSAEEQNQQSYSPSPRIIEEDFSVDPTGSQFIADFKARMRSSATKTKTPVSSIITTREQRPTGLNMTEEELDRRIVELATQVSKNMIKKVILESTKNGSGIILETDKVKKVEIVGNNVVKLGGKLYKLTPVKAQQ